MGVVGEMVWLMDAQAPPKDLRMGLSRLRVTDEDTEAQRGAVTCPGSHSHEVVERLALFQPPVLFTSGAWEWWPWYPPGEGLSPHCPCN